MPMSPKEMIKHLRKTVRYNAGNRFPLLPGKSRDEQTGNGPSSRQRSKKRNRAENT